MDNNKFSKLASIVEEKGFNKITDSEEYIEYSLWDSPYKGNHGFPKITRDLRSGEQTRRVLIPDKPDWSKTHWKIKSISSKEKEENKLKEMGYTKIRDVVLHVVEFVKESSAIQLHGVKNLGYFISTTGTIDRALIQKTLGIKKFSGSYDDFIFGKPWKTWKELSGNKSKIEELRREYRKKEISIEKVKDKIYSIVGKAPDGAKIKFYLNLKS